MLKVTARPGGGCRYLRDLILPPPDSTIPTVFPQLSLIEPGIYISGCNATLSLQQLDLMCT